MIDSKTTTHSPTVETVWPDLLASIPDSDLDLLISAGKKMRQGEAILNAQELAACLRWYPQIDIVPLQERYN